MVALEHSETTTKSAGPIPAETHGCLQAYQQELGYLLGSLRRLAVPNSDIEDVLHEVFLVMLARWDDYDRARPLRPWLFGIAFRVASTHRRKSWREVLDDDHDAPDLREGPDDNVAAKQSRTLLLNALAQVPLERRAVLIMHEIDETSMRDVARHLEIPLFTAYSRLRKARQELDVALVRLQKGSARAR
ncbi:MAG: sigma-70 family RNA polymerase sigma factor [Myxococcales bacterium]